MAAPQVAERRARRQVTGIRSFVLTFVFVAVLTSLGIYQVWQRYEVYTMRLDLSTETLEYRSLLDENRRLQLELATLKGAESIRQGAAERLEMQIPAPQDVVEVR